MQATTGNKRFTTFSTMTNMKNMSLITIRSLETSKGWKMISSTSNHGDFSSRWSSYPEVFYKKGVLNNLQENDSQENTAGGVFFY